MGYSSSGRSEAIERVLPFAVGDEFSSEIVLHLDRVLLLIETCERNESKKKKQSTCGADAVPVYRWSMLATRRSRCQAEAGPSLHT